MRALSRYVALASASLAPGLFFTAPVSAEGWPPEPMVEMRVPVEPTAFPAAGRHYLVYELRLTNLAKSPTTIRRIEVRDAQSATAAPLAIYAAGGLDAVLQHFGDPAVGDQMPTAGAGHRELAPGESALVFLTVVLEPGARVPAQLVHRLSLGEGTIDGARASTQQAKLPVISPPLAGGPWQALSGAGDNTAHHRRQFVVLAGRCLMPTRDAIDWKRMENGAFSSGAGSSGAGEKNVDYFSYGQPVLAVANGRIVAIQDGMEDNHPGHVGAEAFHLTRETIGGNYVVLELGDGRFAQYMHLKPGSLRVTVGDRVKRGQVIAQVGSSGSSFEPHLHFQVTDAPSPIEGDGMPYVIDGFETDEHGFRARHERELPLKGWVVEFPAVR